MAATAWAQLLDGKRAQAEFQRNQSWRVCVPDCSTPTFQIPCLHSKDVRFGRRLRGWTKRRNRLDFGSLDEAANGWMLDTLWDAGVHIMGSRTFRDMMAYWPSSSEPFAAPMNQIPKIAFSRTRVPDTDRASSRTRALEDPTRVQLAEGSESGSTVSSGAVSWTDAPVVSGDLADEVTMARYRAEDLTACAGDGRRSVCHRTVRPGAGPAPLRGRCLGVVDPGQRRVRAPTGQPGPSSIRIRVTSAPGSPKWLSA